MCGFIAQLVEHRTSIANVNCYHFFLYTEGDHPGVLSTAIPGMDTALNPAEELPDIDRYDLGEKG